MTYKKGRGKKLKIIIMTAALTVILLVYAPISRATDLNTQKKQMSDRIEELENLESEIKRDLGQQSGELMQMSNNLSATQAELDATERDILAHEQNIELMNQVIEKQYRDMCVRIQYMYENSTDFSLGKTLLTCDSITDFLNRGEYVGSVMSYDRNKLEEYAKSLESIEDEKRTLEEKYEKRSAEKAEMEVERDELLSIISDNEKKLVDTAEKKEAAEDELAEIIEKMKRLEAVYLSNRKEPSLEEIYAWEAESEGTSGRPVSAAGGEEALLAAIIYCESGGESYTSQLAVGSVVLNRVNSSWFPNTITEVIYSPRQFSPVASGRLAVVLQNGLASESCRNAAREVLSGNITGNWLYFRVNDGSRSGTVIGKQVFY